MVFQLGNQHTGGVEKLQREDQAERSGLHVQGCQYDKNAQRYGKRPRVHSY